MNRASSAATLYSRPVANTKATATTTSTDELDDSSVSYHLEGLTLQETPLLMGKKNDDDVAAVKDRQTRVGVAPSSSGSKEKGSTYLSPTSSPRRTTVSSALLDSCCRRVTNNMTIMFRPLASSSRSGEQHEDPYHCTDSDDSNDDEWIEHLAASDDEEATFRDDEYHGSVSEITEPSFGQSWTNWPCLEDFEAGSSSFVAERRNLLTAATRSDPAEPVQIPQVDTMDNQKINFFDMSKDRAPRSPTRQASRRRLNANKKASFSGDGLDKADDEG